jgi:hypothetical protein
VWSNSISVNSEILPTELNGPHFTEFENFKFQQLLGSLKHVNTITM